MAIYGQQDAMLHEHRDELQELVVVRGFDDEFDRHFFVKTMRADLRSPSGSRVSPSELFLESAQTQRQIVQAGGFHWAAVHVFGVGPRGPYVVLDYYPRSVDDFVQKKTPLSPRSLHRIVCGAVDGLIELQRIRDRPHGNLKPSNILIGPGEVERAAVVLTDPAPLEQLATQGRGDAYDLGQLIHCLVLQRRFSGSWPIEASAGWTSLGSKGRGWRELCNRLLNPNPDKRPRLRQIRADLSRLECRRSAAPRVAIAGGLGAFVLAAVGAIYVYDPLDLRRPPGGTEMVVAQSQVRPATAPAAVPSATANAAEAAIKEEPPREQERVETPPVAELAASELADLRRVQAAFASRGWAGAAEYLGELITRAAAEPGDGSDVEGMAAVTAAIERDWSAVAQTLETLGAVDDRIVRSYGAAVEDATAAGKTERSAESLRKLAASLNGLANDADWANVAAFVASPRFEALDPVYFTQASEAHRNFGDRRTASAEDLRAWLRDAASGDYNRLDAGADPRRSWAAAEQLQRLRETELPRLVKLAPANDAADARGAEYQEELQSVEARIASVRGLAWDRRHEGQVRQGVREVDKTVSRLANELKQAIAQRESEAAMAAVRAEEEAELAKRRAEMNAFVSESKHTTVSTNPAIQKEWESHVESVASALEKDPRPHSPELRGAVSELRQRLAAVDAAHRGLPMPAEAKSDQPPRARQLATVIHDAASERREAFLSDALVAARSEPSLEQCDAQLKRLAEAYAGWLAESRELHADVGDLESLLAAGYAPDEKPDATMPSAREVLARLERKSLWRDERVQAAVEPLARAMATARSNDWRALLEGATDAAMPLGARIAAWERLGAATNAPWPANQEQLAQNLQLEEDLRAAIEPRVTDGARAKELAGRLEQPGRRNWQRFLTRASSQAEIDLALRLKDRYVAADVTMLDRRSQLNVMLHDLRRLLAEAGQDASKQPAVQEQIARIEASIAALPADLSGHPDVASLAAAIRGYRAAADGATINAGKLGPMSAQAGGPGAIRWTYSYDARNETLTCVPELPRELTGVPPEIVFKRIEGSEETPAFFISTTEVSVGLFGDIVRAAGKDADFGRLLAGHDPRGRDTRVGPRSWYWHPWRSGPILQNTITWFAAESDHYAPALRDSLNGTVLKDVTGERAAHLNPSNRHPIQYVSPGAAVAFAELLGCRIPAPQEWQLAHRAFPTARPNLRDQTWRIQDRWAMQSRASSRYLPDRGIFVPAGEKPVRNVWTEAQVGGRAPPAADRDYNDGVLFFHEIAPNGGQSFNHLVGNVAEYALSGDRLYVIGGSALSPPEPVRAVDRAYEVENWRDGSNEGYSDVGFRLAFTAPPAPLEQLRLAIEKQRYLTASRSTTRPIAVNE